MSLRIAIVGHGKMGRSVEQVVHERGHQVAAIVGRAKAPQISRALLRDADVAIEFSVPEAAVPNAIACVRSGVPVVVGTTGWNDRLGEVQRTVAAEGGALLWAPNFAIGVHLMARLVELVASLAPARHGFAAHLVETHHTAKKDAPSGTAVMLARVFGGEEGRDLPTTSVRVGHVPGRHELVLDSQYEQIRLLHEARDRRVFADGAVTAAQWLVRERRQGVFTLRDVLDDHGGGTE